MHPEVVVGDDGVKNVLGLIKERDRPLKAFDAFLQERLFDPCGMTSTWFQVPDTALSRMTTNQQRLLARQRDDPRASRSRRFA